MNKFEVNYHHNKKRPVKIKRVVFFLVILILLALIGYIFIKKFWRNNPTSLNIATSSPQSLPEPSSSTNSTNEIASPIDISVPKGKFYAPVLLYHHIKKKTPQSSYYVSPEIFDSQMNWLKNNNYHVISFADFYSALHDKKSLPDKPVVITLDDGWTDQYTEGFPILKKYGYTAMFYIKLNNVGEGKGGMTWEMLNKLVSSGMEIGSHTINHNNLKTMDDKTLDYELSESKNILEKNLGIPIKHFAYPMGNYSDKVIEELKKFGYLSATTVNHAVFHSREENPYLITRVHVDDEMPSFIDWIQGKNLK